MIELTTIARDKGSNARVTEFDLNGTRIRTPLFMPVGTKATVKTLECEEVTSLGYPIVLSNTYHLYLRPGSQRIQDAGGIHRFMGHSGKVLTDSGGFQVYSLKDLRKIHEDGVEFRSIIDGSAHKFTPENVVQTQRQIGADIIMAFDECPPGDASYEYVQSSMVKTHRWALESLEEHQKDPRHQHLFGIIQGGIFEDLRLESQKYIQSLEFDGIAIGGLSVGESHEDMIRILSTLAPGYLDDKPRYLMGVGTPRDLIEGVRFGIDMFDCVMPTRVARHGKLYTSKGALNLLNSRFRTLDEPVDPDCSCNLCSLYSASYLHHLLREKEFLGLKLASLHNLAFFFKFMEDMQKSIQDGSFEAFRDEQLELF